MSHIAIGKTRITDIDCLVAAAQSMGLTVRTGGKPRYYGTQSGGSEAVECDYVVLLPGMYDLGLKRQGDGAYAFVCDTELLSGSYGRGKEGREVLGEHAEKLMNEYAYEAAKAEAVAGNYSVERTFDGDEQVIYLTRY